MPLAEKQNGEQSLGKILSTIHWQSRIYVEKKLKPYDLGWGEFHVLMKLCDRKEMKQSEITECLRITKATTSKVIHRLEKDGYITRKRYKRDERTYIVRATRKAVKMKTSLRKISREWNGILLNGFEKNEGKEIRHALSKITKNAEEANSED